MECAGGRKVPMLVGAVGIILEPNQAEMVVLNMVQSLSLAAVLNLIKMQMFVQRELHCLNYRFWKMVKPTLCHWRVRWCFLINALNATWFDKWIFFV
jgi:hypothetical protein